MGHLGLSRETFTFSFYLTSWGWVGKAMPCQPTDLSAEETIQFRKFCFLFGIKRRVKKDRKPSAVNTKTIVAF
jgi:hypothetical protein